MADYITVSGRGRANHPADRAVLSITLSVVEKEYAETLDRAEAQLTKLREELAAADIRSADLKSQSFNIHEEYENRESRVNVHGIVESQYKQVLIGFRCDHRLLLDVTRDSELISRLIRMLSRSETNCEFNLRFKVEDERKIRVEAAVDAVRNAREMAMSLAQAAGLTLGSIRNIRYTFAGNNVYSASDIVMPRHQMMEASTFKMDFEPEDVSQEEEVTIEYTLE